ncbi:MAG: response regulator [Gemmatimonadetes bacterium]|nr:response regulator [Gemmatimonadota bacterium]
MFRTRSIVNASFFLLLIAGGLYAVVYGGRVLKDQARKTWLDRANQEATRITETGLSWLTHFNAQQRGVATLFYGSQRVTEDELFDALDIVQATEGSIPLASLAFVEAAADDERFTVSLSTEFEGFLEPGTDLAVVPAARAAIAGALEMPDQVIMGPAFHDAEGRPLTLLALAAPNGDMDGAVVTLIDLTALFDGLQRLYIPLGLHLRLVEEDDRQIGAQLRLTIIGPDEAPPETVRTFSIVTNSGQAHWEFFWDVLPTYLDGPDTQLAELVQLSGLTLILFAFGLIGFLYTQNLKVNRRVQERTAELEEARIEAERARESSDIARKEAEEVRKIAEDSREVAESANRSKSAFLANMSLEIRTPMNAILGFTEILGGLLTDPRQKGYLDSIQTSGKSLLSLINDILDLSKVEAGKLELEYRPTDVPAAFADMEQIFAHRIATKKLNFQLDISPDLPRILLLDETRLRQILINLLGNAVKFTDSGGVKLSAAHIQSDSEHIDLSFAIEDTGIGIPASQQQRIFRTFEQQEGQSINQYGGTGLGLAITRRLIEMMNGDISVESEAGKGSTFRVTLHNGAIAPPESQPLQQEAAIDIEELLFAPATILVADDVALNRDLVKGFLTDCGLTLLEAENGREAIDITRTQRPDLVLMDIKMPVLDGYAATRQLKADRELQKIPVVALTASAMKETEEELSQTCDGFLRKPVTKAELIHELARFLERIEAIETEDSGPEPATEAAFAPDAAIRERLPELIQQLEGERDVWEEISNTLTINDIDNFSARVKDMGTEFGYLPISSWGEKLQNQVALFDMTALPETLQQFPALIEEIQSFERESITP